MKTNDTRELKRYLEKLKLIGESGRVNYAESPEDKIARIKRAKKDYAFFVATYFPHYAEFPCADFHILAANEVLRDKQYNGVQEWARGLAKSTHFDIFVPIWLHLFHNQLNCMLLVGKNFYSAKRLLSDVQAELEANPQLEHDFGKLVQQGSWEEGNFITQTGAAFYALGKGQSPRGMRNGPHRPDFIVLDDADDDEEARNPRRIDDSVSWVYRALLPAMGSEITRFVMVNNRIAPYCILSNLVANPVFKHRKVNAVDAQGNPSWSKYTKEFYDKIKKRNLAAWLTEYMNEPQIEGKIFINDYFLFRPALRLNQYTRIVAYWDIAYSESKSADYNCVPIVGLVGREKHVLKIFCRQCKMEGALRWMSTIQKNLPATAIIEWYAEGQFWSDAVEMAVQKVGEEMGFRLPIIFLDRPGRQTNKYSRIIQMLPDFQNSDVYWNKNEEFTLDMQEAIKQIKAIEPGYGGHDDAPDALEGAIFKLNPSIIMAGTEPIIGYNEPKKRVW